MSEREKIIEVMARAICLRELIIRNASSQRERDYDDDELRAIAEHEWVEWVTGATDALSALEAAGVRLVPAELSGKYPHHWKIASAGIRAIEEFGGQFGSDHTPERQISDAYRDMVKLAASPYAEEPGNG